MILSALLVLLAAAGSEPLGGAEIGSRLHSRLAPRNNTSDGEDREKSLRMIECGVNRDEAAMRRVLDQSTSRDYEAALNLAFEYRGCSLRGYVAAETDTVVFTFDHATLRGMIAEAVLKKNERVAGHAALPPQPGYMRDWHARTARPVAVDEMASCMADTNPDGIAPVLDAVPGSPDEGMAMRGLGPSLGACLKQGATLNANRIALRSALAEALYHRAFDPAPAAPAAAPLAETSH